MFAPYHCSLAARPPKLSVLVSLSVLISLAMLLLPATGGVGAANEAAVTLVTAEEVLLLGPLPTPWPAFHDSDLRGYDLDDLMAKPTLEPAQLRPRAGDEVAQPGGSPARWRQIAAADGLITLDTSTAAPAETYLVCYLTADRFQAAKLQISGHQVRAYLDGDEVTLKEDQNRDDIAGEPAADEPAADEPAAGKPATGKAAADEPATGEPTSVVPTMSGELALPMGTHTLVVRTIRAPEASDPWQIGIAVARADSLPPAALAWSIEPVGTVGIETILDAPRIAGAAISPDGKLVAVTLGEYDPNGERETWLEIRTTEDSTLQRSWRGGGSIAQIQWAPDGHRLSYTGSGDGKATLWLYNLDTGTITAIVRDVEKFGSYRWAPDGNSIVYAVTVEAEKDDRKVKRVRNLADRQSWWRNRSYLMQASVPAGMTRRLTAGPLSPESWRLSPDGQKLLFFLSEPDLTQRPYSTSELWELDLATLATEKILTDRWIGGAEYGPEPESLLLQGSPSAFAGLGRNLPDGVQANDYGGQLYLFDRNSGEATPITKTFTPAVVATWWSLADGRIYALCTDTQYRNVYAYDHGKQKWQQIDTGIAFTAHFAPARSARTAVAYGSGAAVPTRLYAVDLKRNRSRLLLDPGADAYGDIAFGTVEPWTCQLPDGEELDGRIYFPPDFDPQQTYPVIVYYYGGTSPVTVDFGGRYPKNVWAGQGYLVYVPEPSGATGYGQAFAARHVNDWGQRTAWEVIEATRAFLSAHPYADGQRVGCIGASYGGFLTEYIITQTDLYTAAVSHAGISSISSYWGEGLWGYAYGARALADAFPWQNRDLYIEQSPLFHADKITTPLLLLHGDSDTNVPVGESDQPFTALRLLGRDVEYVQMVGQDHHILNHDQRIVWNDTILAYFARYLKGRPAWWEHLYPAED